MTYLKTKKNIKAFSLIEFSIVLIITGLLVASVMAGKALIISSKLADARNLTTNSVVNTSIDAKYLIIWLETVSKKSFDSGTPENGSSIGTWKNILSSATGNNATSPATKNNPTYIAEAINGLPALRFDGSSDYLNYDGTALANSDYSVFVVEQRRSDANGLFIGGNENGDNKKLHLGYRSNTQLTFSQFNNDFNVDIAGYTSPIPRIHSFIFSSSIGKDYYVNGTKLKTCVDSSGVNCKQSLVSYNFACIGVYSPTDNSRYNGDIGEIIIYSKALSDEERQDVETYLSRKWKITLQ